MKLSVIVPAFNEEKYLPLTLEKLAAGLAVSSVESEMIVVDNGSTDKTAEIARAFGCQLVPEGVHNIGAVRNAGALAASGDIFIFLDADTLVPAGFFETITRSMLDEKCLGGAFAVEYSELKQAWVKYYLLGWKFWERFLNAKQGAAQFCRRPVFMELHGYDDSIFVGEDVEFYWRLTKLAKNGDGRVNFITDIKVKTSARRFNEMSPWRLLLRTNPIFIRLNWRRRGFWRDWYENTVR